MNANQVERYLRDIDGFVMDEQKIVTFKLLSRQMNLNVNTAKQLLHLYYIKQQQIKPSSVSATYFLAGTSKDGAFLVSIITANELDEAYSKYDKVTSEHIYSIQKGGPSGLEKNSQILFIVDSSLPPPKSYPIKYHKILMENSVGKPKMKTSSQEAEVKTETNSDEKRKENKTTIPKEEQTSKKPSLISNFFNNQGQGKKSDKQETGKVKREATEKEESPKNKPVPEVSDEDKFKDKLSGKNVRVKERKKRKRILSASEESESDEEKADALLCAEPDISLISEKLRLSDDDGDDDFYQKKRKRKKIVSRTVLHDDGFMETFKEMICETDSDEETTRQTNEEAKISGDNYGAGRAPQRVEKEESVGGKGKAPLQKDNPKKQATLFSFFKKN